MANRPVHLCTRTYIIGYRFEATLSNWSTAKHFTEALLPDTLKNASTGTGSTDTSLAGPVVTKQVWGDC